MKFKSILYPAFLITTYVAATTINVPADYSTIQAGINAAVDGDTVLVQPGTYQENITWGQSNVVLASSYINDQDTSFIHNTFIDGGANGPCITLYNVGSLAGHIIGFKITNGYSQANWPYSNGGGINCISSDLVIEPSVIVNNQSVHQGGGIYSWGSVIQILDVEIVNNVAEHSGPGLQLEHSTVTIDSTIISDNESVQNEDGGVSCYQTDMEINNSIINGNTGRGVEIRDSSNVTIANCDINNNTTNHNGGGINCNDSYLNLLNSNINNNIGGGLTGDNSEIIINQSNFQNNSSMWQWASGGALNIRSSNIEVLNCEFINNSAVNYEWAKGGAISYSLRDSSQSYTARIINCLFEDNYALQRGGAVQFDNRSPSDTVKLFVNIKDCEFINNSAMVSGAIDIEGRYAETFLSIDSCSIINNSALHDGGGMTISRDAISTISNTLIANNTSSLSDTAEFHSGGVNIWGGANVDFLNCTITENIADYGAGITIQSGATSNITNCILWRNVSDQIALVDYDSLGGTLTIDYSDLQGGIDSVAVGEHSSFYFGVHVLDSNPLFCSPDSGDYTLAENSPCVGAGNNGLNIGSFDVGCDPLSTSDYSATIPYSHKLFQNYPNPFNPTTQLRYNLPEQVFVQLAIYNLLGRQVTILVNQIEEPGQRSATWNGTDNQGNTVSAGMYLYVIKAGDFVQTRKMILLK